MDTHPRLPEHFDQSHFNGLQSSGLQLAGLQLVAGLQVVFFTTVDLLPIFSNFLTIQQIFKIKKITLFIAFCLLANLFGCTNAYTPKPATAAELSQKNRDFVKF